MQVILLISIVAALNIAALAVYGCIIKQKRAEIAEIEEILERLGLK